MPSATEAAAKACPACGYVLDPQTDSCLRCGYTPCQFCDDEAKAAPES